MIAAYWAYCKAHPPKQARKRLEQAFHRAKVRGLVTGDKLGWQAPSTWRLAAPGEVPRLWLRRPGNEWRPRNLRVVRRSGGFYFDYGWPRGCRPTGDWLRLMPLRLSRVLRLLGARTFRAGEELKAVVIL